MDINGVSVSEYPGLVKEVPARKLLLERIIRHWPDGERLVWTDYIFLFCLERIAVRVVNDRSTGQTSLEASTDGKFFVDEARNRVVSLLDKPVLEEFLDKGHGGESHWPVAAVLQTKNGPLKLVVHYEEVEQTFDLFIEGLPARLMAKATANPEQQSVP